jgi:hypothetical protein
MHGVECGLLRYGIMETSNIRLKNKRVELEIERQGMKCVTPGAVRTSAATGTHWQATLRWVR